ncbi:MULTISPECIES: RNA polymerase sigma factor [Mesorhizobium]|uniref:RNA polymerase sigma factor n=1 Tax=Mesorhizobium denitrificans TaxID=2294114 RepID=A0A371XIU5_9HYPH|nr:MULTISPECIES: RNA polymerase sigma factor [Mesorhizobium]RFC69131.1 RNA polymerase sigma factor [Mesorhizobium denitrificans]
MDDRRTAILAEIPRLRRYARALLRGRESSDDLVQDTLERALGKMENWQTGDSPRRWLFTIMHHLFIDQTRRRNRRGEDVMLSLDDDEALGQQALQQETAEAGEVLDALSALSPDRRAAIVLVGVEGFSYAEAAGMLGVPAGTVMSRVARGREEMRRLLDDNARRKTLKVVEK